MRLSPSIQIATPTPGGSTALGRNSNRMTPLRVLLRPGKHKVTLFDKQRATARDFVVTVHADHTSKLAK